MAYPQADISTDHVNIKIRIQGHICLHVLKNIYGSKDVGRTWNQYLVKGLKEMGFMQLTADECVFY
jgi:hypothetical protein